MIGLKVAAVAVADVAFGVVAALDDLGQQIVLWSAAGAGILWALVHVVKPGVRWIRSVFRSAEAFEQLPEWMATMESEVGHALAKLTRMENRQRAFNRDMGIRARGDVELAEEPADSFDGPSESA